MNFLENSTWKESHEFKNKIGNLCNHMNHDNSQIVLENHLNENSIPSFPGDMSNWIQSLINVIDILLNMIHFERIANWEDHLQLIQNFLPWCFVLNKHKYARNLSYHYVGMCNLNEKNPRAYEYLKEGGSTASLSGMFIINHEWIKS